MKIHKCFPSGVLCLKASTLKHYFVFINSLQRVIFLSFLCVSASVFFM